MPSDSIRNNIYSFYHYCRRYKVTKTLDSLRITQWLSKEEIEKKQWQRVLQLSDSAKRDVEYYKKIFKKIDIKKENFQDIPFLTKNIINRNRENLISKKYQKTDLNLNSTSGSTGEKLIFYTDKKIIKNREYYRDAVNYRGEEWICDNIWEKKVLLWGLHNDVSKVSNLKDKLMNWCFHILFLSTYDLTPDLIELYVKKINKFKPKLIVGQPSALFVFSNYLKLKNIKIFSPYAIISSAEMLYSYQRKIIESVFNCKIFNRYGCREFGAIAQECEMHKGMHINAEHVFVEIVDEKGNPCKPGELGEIVITDLDNYGFPFIRYKIGDLGVLSDRRCSCGRGLPLLEKVEGRTWDVIVCPNGNHLTGTFWTILLREEVDGIDNFQLIQQDINEINLKLVINTEFTENEKKKLLKKIENNCGKEMKVEIQLVKKIEPAKSGKHRFVISKVSPFL